MMGNHGMGHEMGFMGMSLFILFWLLIIIAVQQDPRLRCVAGEAKGGFSELAKSQRLEVAALTL